MWCSELYFNFPPYYAMRIPVHFILPSTLPYTYLRLTYHLPITFLRFSGTLYYFTSPKFLTELIRDTLACGSLITVSLQNVIQENPFTADMLRTETESPSLSIGEAIDGPEKMISNPFLTEQPGGEQPTSSWDIYKQQVREGEERVREGERERGGRDVTVCVCSLLDGGTDGIDERTSEARNDS